MALGSERRAEPLRALLLALAACAPDAMVVTPVIDVPSEDPDATASPLDDIELTVAHAGSDRELVSHTFARGEPLELPGVLFGDDLVIHMSGFVGASKIAYGRSCVFSVAAGGEPPTPHVFFSRSVKFASVQVRPVPRFGGMAIPYLGTALFVGGSDGDKPVPVVELFDPMTGALTEVGTVMPRNRAVHALVGTSPPRAVVLGGTEASNVNAGAKFVEVVDSRRVELVEHPELAHVGLTATTLTDGRAIVIGGATPGVGSVPVGDIYAITPMDASIEVRRLAATLAVPRSGHSATRLGDDVGAPVLIAGGADSTGAMVASAELFKPLSEELADPKKLAWSMLAPRRDHSAMLMPDGSVLFIGGVDASGNPVTRLELFSVDAGFVDVGTLPPGAGVVDFTSTLLPDGRTLITGGRARAGQPPLDSAYIARLDPMGGSVDIVATDHLAIARANHQAVPLCDGTVLISGGTAGQFAAERYNPPHLARR